MGTPAPDAVKRLVDHLDLGREVSLSGDYSAAKTPHEQESIKRRIAASDGQIDSLVYELYGLTEEEIRIVEGGE